MKKNLAVLFLGIFLASCNAPTSPSLPANAPADQYFFPTVNGTQYVYSEGTLNVSDTTTYQIIVGVAYDSYAKLVKKDTGINNPVLYYYKVGSSNAGIQQCILSETGSDQGMVALQGDLSVGSKWFTDKSDKIEATVVGRYTDYFLPGHQQVIHDVVAVKYIDNTKTDGSYVVRFFARDLGLILQRTIYDASTEISNLQLLSRLSAPTNGPGAPDDHGHWYDQRGRYIMQWNLDLDETLKK